MKQRYGHWTVIGPESEGSVTCCCDCGTIREVDVRLLESGVSTSCGCIHAKANDLTGQRFGRLTARYPLPVRSPDNDVMWFCDCDCGGSRVTTASLLTSGRRRSCGCLAAQTDHLTAARTFVDGTCLELLFSDTIPKNNTSGCKGVSKKGKRWRATITVAGKTKWLGVFDEYEDAVKARRAAEAEARDQYVDSRQQKDNSLVIASDDVMINTMRR